MSSQHKHPPISFRPPEGDRMRLLALAERTAQPVNRILSDSLAEYLNTCSDPPEESCSDAGCPVHGEYEDLDD